MMDEEVSWCIKESRGIGLGKVHRLTMTGLTIGRHPDADIVVLSKTVDIHHAAIEWDRLTRQYLIRDLNSVNGTFVNQLSLRGTTQTLQLGDGLRFGYDTAQTFRVENNPTTISPNGESEATSSPQTTSITTTSQTTSVEPLTSSKQSVPMSQPIVTQSPTPQVTQPQPVQYIPSPSTTIIIPTNQYGVPPQLVPQVLSVTMAPVTMTTPQMITTVSLINSTSNTTPPTISIPEVTTITTSEESVRIRIDGRKSVPLSDTPSLSKGSPLYGVPSWWGEDDAHCSGACSDSELSPKKRGSQILRDLDPKSDDESKTPSKRSSYRGQQYLTPVSRNTSNSLTDVTKNKDTQRQLRAQSVEEESTSFTIEFEAPRRSKPKGPHRTRPASFAGRFNELSHPVAKSPPLQSSPKRTPKSTNAEKVVSTKPNKTPPIRKPPSGIKFTGHKNTGNVVPKCPPVQSSRMKSTSSTTNTTSITRNKTFTIKDIEEDSSGQSSSTIIAPAPITSATPLRSHSATVVPWSSLLQGTPQTPGSDSGSSRPGSARKQWINEQIPHGLIMASIEARVRRLADTAHNTTDIVNHFIHSLKEQGVQYSTSSISSIGSLTPIDKSPLPQWKVINKEYDSICQYISATEKSLQAICQKLGMVLSKEDIDYDNQDDDKESVASEELLIDSLEDNRGLLPPEPLDNDSDDDELYYSASSEADDD